MMCADAQENALLFNVVGLSSDVSLVSRQAKDRHPGAREVVEFKTNC